MNPTKSILLIDDDDIFVFLTRKTLKKTKLIDLIQVFGNGKDAIDYLQQIQIANNTELLPEIIFLDLNMPIMDGWAFLEDYTQLRSSVREKMILYLITSSISPHDIKRAKNISAIYDFIIKPLSEEKIRSIVKNHISCPQ